MSKKAIRSNIEDHNGIRISYHEKVCAERMKTLFNRIDEMKKDMKSLKEDVSEVKANINKSKGGLKVLIAIGSIVAGVVGFFKYDG
jgi:uncharacterized coiled-coil DUF342 family protein|tara:strand:- start:232 stop:489 length:258 start_codon:yes stop_codon:yes gene_type:complete